MNHQVQGLEIISPWGSSLAGIEIRSGPLGRWEISEGTSEGPEFRHFLKEESPKSLSYGTSKSDSDRAIKLHTIPLQLRRYPPVLNLPHARPLI